MTPDTIENDFQKKVCKQIRVESEGKERFRVFTPFMFDDGDHLAVVLKKDNSQWVLSDEGHTYMHLTYEIDERDLQRGTRQKIISNVLSLFSIRDQQGELTLPIDNDEYGDALYSFTQALLKISDVSYLTRERARSTFMDDFQNLIIETVPDDRRSFNWHDPVNDSQGVYPVDCRVNSMDTPLFVFALPSDARTRDATISLHQFEKWGLSYQSLSIFEDQETVNRKVLARFSDVSDKQFSSLTANRDRIKRYIHEVIQ